MKRSMTLVLLVSALAGAVVAAFFMYVAWQHNPQGEFHEQAIDGTLLIRWWNWLLVGFSAFLVGSVSLSLVSGAVFLVSSLSRPRKSAG